MNSDNEFLVTPRVFFRILLRHRVKAAVTAGLLAAVSLAVARFLPPTFHSEAKLFVRIGRESVALDPTATTGQTISVYESRENEINSILEILRSRALAQGVVDRIGAETILFKTAVGLSKKNTNAANSDGGAFSAVSDWMRFLTGSPAVTQRERAVETIDEWTSVTAAKRSSVITVDCQATRPELALQIVQALLDEYRTQHQKANSIDGSYDFFHKQVSLLEKEVNAICGEVCRVKNAYGIVSVEGQRQLLLSQFTQIESNWLTNGGELAASRAKLAALHDAIKVLPEQIVSQEVMGFANAAADTMRLTLYQLEIRERELTSKFSDKHPEVSAVRQQLQDAQAIMASQEGRRTQSTRTWNPEWRRLRLEILAEEPHVAYLEAKAETLRDQRGELNESLRLLNQREVELEDLERKASILENSYVAHRQKFEEARVQRAMEMQSISNVNVVQNPMLIEKPVGPKRRLLAAFGCFVALVSGIGVALMAEYLAVEDLPGAARETMTPQVRPSRVVRPETGAEHPTLAPSASEVLA